MTTFQEQSTKSPFSKGRLFGYILKVDDIKLYTVNEKEAKKSDNIMDL